VSILCHKPEIVPIDSVHLDPSNVRRHPTRNLDNVKSSLKKYGQRKAIVVNRRSGIVEAGNCTVKAARALGWSKIAVVFVDDDEVTAASYALVDNRSAELAEWDDNLGAMLLSLNADGVDLDELGWSDEELARFVASDDLDHMGELVEDGEHDESTAERLGIEAGQVWKIGPHRLAVGDCTDSELVGRLFGDEKCSLITTDPPYGVDVVESAKSKDRVLGGFGVISSYEGISSDDLKPADLKELISNAFLTSFDFTREKAAFYCWYSMKLNVFRTAIESAGFIYHQNILWLKPQLVPSFSNYHSRFELCLHGWKSGKGKCPWYGKMNQTDVWEVKRENDKIHPTQKPLELFERPIINHTLKGDIVYDPFCCSCTSMVAAHTQGRRAFCVEISKQYCGVIIDRMAKLGVEARLGV
jgi:DNA modification methylase